MRLTSFFAHKMACEYRRRIILSWIKTLNCSLSIAVKILGQNIKFVLQMRINKWLLISIKILKSHNYPHIGHIFLIKCKMILVQRLGTLNSSIGQRKNSQLPSLLAAAWNIRARRARAARFYITYLAMGEKVRVTWVLSSLTPDPKIHAKRISNTGNVYLG